MLLVLVIFNQPTGNIADYPVAPGQAGNPSRYARLRGLSPADRPHPETGRPPLEALDRGYHGRRRGPHFEEFSDRPRRGRVPSPAPSVRLLIRCDPGRL